MHPYDRFFYDPLAGYTVDKFLDDLNTRYGGVDSILLWPTYTNIGIDDRNQFDYFRCMPGGLAGVKNVTDQLKARGVRVLWPYNPWDLGTRREPLSDEDTFAKLLKQTHGDGFNGDTMDFVGQSFWAAAEKADYPLAFEPEGGGTDDALNWSTMGWGYWSYLGNAGPPGVDRQKFLTRGKFMTNICNRWAKDKTDDLQHAWFNGAGYESWENVWGTWNGITPRDGEAIRRVGAMSRFFGGKVDSTSFPTPRRDFLHSSLWEPHYQGAMQSGVFASKFTLQNDTSINLYTLINRNSRNLTGQQLWLGGDSGPLLADAVFFDCHSGAKLQPETPKAPASPMPPVPTGYNAYYGQNCFKGHGGDEIDTNPTPGLTVAQCAARCTADQRCSCVAYQSADDGIGAPRSAVGNRPSVLSTSSGTDTGYCWKRSNCEPEGFEDTGAGYDVYAKAVGYKKWASRNCYDGAGGHIIDENPAKNLSVFECQSRCDADDACSCVTYDFTAKDCWKRASCEPANFDVGDQWDTYVKQSVQPSCAAGGACRPPVPAPPGATAVSFDFEANGYGCVLQTTVPVDAELTAFLTSMKAMTAKPLSAYDATWQYLTQVRVEIAKTAPATAAPAGTVYVPQSKNYKFAVTGVMVEGDDAHGVDVQFPWETHPQREHSAMLSVGPFYIGTFLSSFSLFSLPGYLWFWLSDSSYILNIYHFHFQTRIPSPRRTTPHTWRPRSMFRPTTTAG
jgi:hypothetical protein